MENYIAYLYKLKYIKKDILYFQYQILARNNFQFLKSHSRERYSRIIDIKIRGAVF